MVERKTIILKDEVYKAIQKYRAKKILKGEEISFSQAVNELIKKAIENKLTGEKNAEV